MDKVVAGLSIQLKGYFSWSSRKLEKNLGLTHIHAESLDLVKPWIRLSLKGSGRFIFRLFV